MRIVLIQSDGNQAEKVFSKTSVVIGRSKLCDLQLQDEALSRQHCQIDLVNGDFYVTDLGSSNGVFLDGQKIPPHQRTKFNTFQQLSIGALDCKVSDEMESEGLSGTMLKTQDFKPTSDMDSNLSPTKPTRKINTQILNDDRKIETKTTKPQLRDKLPWYVPVVVVLLFVSFFIFENQNDQKEQDQPKPSPEQILMNEVPENMRSISDDFDSTETYLAKDGSKNCPDSHGICEQMGLNSGSGEGVKDEGLVVYVFFKPDLHLQKFERIKESRDLYDIVALYSLMNTNFFGEFTKKKFAQIHLIMKSSEGKLFRVHRFHVKGYFGNEKNLLMTALSSALETGNILPFRPVAKGLIKSQEIL